MLNATFTDCTRPFLVHFFTNAAATAMEAALMAPKANRGLLIWLLTLLDQSILIL